MKLYVKLLLFLFIVNSAISQQEWKLNNGIIYPKNKAYSLSLREGYLSGLRLGYTTRTDSGWVRYLNGVVQFYNGSSWQTVASSSGSSFDTTRLAYLDKANTFTGTPQTMDSLITNSGAKVNGEFTASGHSNFGGGSTFSNILMNVSESVDFDPTTEYFGGAFTPRISSTVSTRTQPTIGVIGRVYVDSTNTKNWTHGAAGAVGVEGSVNVLSNSSGTITNAASFWARGAIDANSSRITNYYQMLMEGLTSSVLLDTVDNAYGLYVGNISSGITSNYSIYTNTGKVHFGDNVLIDGSTRYLTVDATRHMSLVSTGSSTNIFYDDGANLIFRTQPAADVGTTNNLTTRYTFGNLGVLTIANDLVVSGDSLTATSATGRLSALITTGGATVGGTVQGAKFKFNSVGATVDSAKVSADTLFFYVGGNAYKAVK